MLYFINEINIIYFTDMKHVIVAARPIAFVKNVNSVYYVHSL